MTKDLKERIEYLKRDLAQAKEQVKELEDAKRSARPNARGRIASDDWDLQLKLKRFDLSIAAAKAKVAMIKNQISLLKN